MMVGLILLSDECQFVLKHKYPNGIVGPSYQAHIKLKI